MQIGSLTSGANVLDSLAVLAQNGVGRNALRSTPARVNPVEKPSQRPQDRVELSPAALRDRHSSEESDRETQELKARDREVRSHEQAHKAAGGAHAGGISLTTTTGPDGQEYATGGSVSIDASPVPGDPAATIAKMQQVRRAALAPANPSSADRRVATQAREHENEARAEQAKQRNGGEPGVRFDSATGTYSIAARQERLETMTTFSIVA